MHTSFKAGPDEERPVPGDSIWRKGQLPAGFQLGPSPAEPGGPGPPRAAAGKPLRASIR